MTVRSGPPLEGNLIPSFELPRAGGGRVRVRGFRGRRSLALYFVHGAGCTSCRGLAAAIVPRYGDYAFADAEPLIIVPSSIEVAETFRSELSLPFTVLADSDRVVARRYGVSDGVAPGAALLIADRFGVPTQWQPSGLTHDLPGQDAVLQELEYLAHTCGGGCSTPIWEG